MSEEENQGYKVLDVNASMDLKTFLSQIDDYHVFKIRFTLKPDENNVEFRNMIVHELLHWVQKCGVVQFYTVGFEEMRSHYPHTGLPAAPHIHLHLTLQSSKYDYFKTPLNVRNYKNYVRRHLQEKLKDIGIPWGNSRLYQEIEDNPKKTLDIFEYPLKQFKYQDYKYEDYYRGFTEQEIHDMTLRATTKFDESKKNAEKARDRLENEGMSQFYRELQQHLDLNPATTSSEAIEEIYKFYCKKNKPINPQTIEGYALLYLFKNNIIDLKQFIRSKHRSILSA